MQPGDQVCIILGCQQPLILRLDRDSNHCVVGSLYLCGLMNGEAILDPVSSGYRAVTCVDKDTGLDDLMFENTETGMTDLEDPRLASLELSLNPYRQEWAKGNSVLVDVPLEVLTKRGVEIIWFSLV